MPVNPETLTLEREPPVMRERPCIAWQDASGPHTRVVDQLLVVGSALQADVVIEEPTVSRLHAELEPRADGLWVRDLGSRNGTFVHDVLVSAARVPELGRIRLGATTLDLRPRGEPAPIDLWSEGHLGGLVGSSAVMRELYARIVRVAASESPVLVEGETGSGKELVARALHDCSHRASGPFVVVDCAALPEGLLESELFGHAKGAFTGAASAHVGSFELASGGTVFLDEIGDLPASMQPKLLRVLESRTLRRVGEAGHRPIDVRFISATHRNLRAMVNAGVFREDLYFRLAVLPVHVPPLREHAEDLPALIRHFAPTMDDADLASLCEKLATAALPGNVRELRNVVERVRLLGHNTVTDSAEPFEVDGSMSDLPCDVPFHEFQERTEREYLRRLLLRHGGKAADAAQAAGINRTYFYRLLRKHSL